MGEGGGGAKACECVRKCTLLESGAYYWIEKYAILAGQQPQAHLFSHALESEQCTPTPNGPGPSVQAVERVEPPCALRIRNLHVLPHFVFLRLMRLGVFGCAVFCDHMCVQRSPSVGPACIAQSFSSGNPFSSGVDTNAELPLSLYASGEDARRRGHM